MKASTAVEMLDKTKSEFILPLIPLGYKYSTSVLSSLYKLLVISTLHAQVEFINRGFHIGRSGKQLTVFSIILPDAFRSLYLQFFQLLSLQPFRRLIYIYMPTGLPKMS